MDTLPANCSFLSQEHTWLYKEIAMEFFYSSNSEPFFLWLCPLFFLLEGIAIIIIVRRKKLSRWFYILLLIPLAVVIPSRLTAINAHKHTFFMLNVAPYRIIPQSVMTRTNNFQQQGMIYGLCLLIFLAGIVCLQWLPSPQHNKQ